MNVKFNDGTILKGMSAVEQKLYRDNKGIGWALTLVLGDELTSNDVDSLLTTENISNISLIAAETDEAVEATAEYKLEGYDKVSACNLRYFDGTEKPRIEIRLTKGV